MRLIAHPTGNKRGRPTVPLNGRLFSIVHVTLKELQAITDWLDGAGYKACRLNAEPEYIPAFSVFRVGYLLPADHRSRCTFEEVYGQIYRNLRGDNPMLRKKRFYQADYQRKRRKRSTEVK
ncbi:hypothetical protein [Candidatus Methylomicrobium oryzae]|jgi:hypothetical protein|uniref:hypothetical protein n=1 Tax=Candidatus Methylomicrobium oryzae TaxID=2802053 RepID=UPI001922E372|nr:hypothetical protein [Methylomicrobium sp. RS1]MBL1263631.1 hypothetical protein [Methylomicrobium sp. RS1]